MRIILILIVFVAFHFNSSAQYDPGARQISLSNSDVALSNDVFAVFNNPAGLSQMNWREIGIYYSPSPFGLSELANGFIAYHEPFDFGSIGFGAMTYGFELYRENKITAAFSYNYINKFFIGASLNLHTLFIKNYGDDNAIYISLGGLYYLSDEFKIGFSLRNLNHATFGQEKDNIPTLYNAGFSYNTFEDFSVNFALEKDIRYNFSLRGGIEYELLKYVSLRSGFSNEPATYSAGIGIHYSMFSLDYAFFTHNDLGLTHQAGLIISFGSDERRNVKIRNYFNGKQKLTD